MTTGSRLWLWWWRLVIGASLVAGLLAWGALADLDPDPVITSLLVLVFVALAGLLVDAAVAPPPGWGTRRGRDTDARARDARTAGNLRLLESHLAARHADTSLRDRLRRLALEQLRAHHGLDLDHPRARELIGADVAAVLTGPPRRLTRTEVDSCVTRIERIAR